MILLICGCYGTVNSDVLLSFIVAKFAKAPSGFSLLSSQVKVTGYKLHTVLRLQAAVAPSISSYNVKRTYIKGANKSMHNGPAHCKTLFTAAKKSATPFFTSKQHIMKCKKIWLYRKYIFKLKVEYMQG